MKPGRVRSAEWMKPPSLSARSMRQTRFPAIASSAAATRELMPEPIIAMSVESSMEGTVLSEVRVIGRGVVSAAVEQQRFPSSILVLLHLADIDDMVAGIVS